MEDNEHKSNEICGLTTELASIEFAEGSTLSTIGQRAFSGCNKLTSIDLPDSITSLGAYVFAGCDCLTEITIPFVGASKNNNGTLTSLFLILFDTSETENNYKVVSSYASGSTQTGYLPKTLTKVTVSGGIIPYGAFQNCISLTEIVLKPGVQNIRAYAFGGTPIEKMELPEGLTFVNNYAFTQCTKLAEITLPSTLTNFGYYALDDATGLKRINYNAISLANYEENNGILYPITVTDDMPEIEVVFGPLVQTIPKYLFSQYSFYTKPKISKYVFLGNQCTSIGTGALTSSLENVQCVFDKYTIDDTAPTIQSNSLPSVNKTTIILQDEEVKNKWSNETNWSSYATKMVVSA